MSQPQTDWQSKSFDAAGNSPVAWESRAVSLLAAARFLKSHRDNYDPSKVEVGEEIPDEGLILFPEIMLRGFAVECLMKALWLRQGNRLAADGRYKNIPGAAQHNLVQLADQLGLTLPPVARDVLKRVSIIVVSTGRYPIAREWTATRIQRSSRGGSAPPTHWLTPSDDIALEDVVNTLTLALRSAGT